MSQPVAGLQRNPSRSKADFYPTHPDHTRALFDFLDLTPGAVVWECAAGDGAMIDAIPTHLSVIGTDIEPRRADIIPLDFLRDADPAGVDWIVTNPPFSSFTEFIDRCLQYRRPFALLMPIHYLGGQRRRDEIWHQHPPSQLLVLSARKYLSQFNHVWGIWNGDDGPTRLYWI